MGILSSNRSQRLRRMLATLGVLVAAAGVDWIFPRIPQAAKAAQGSAKTPVVREELILQGSPAQLKEAYYSLSSRRLITVQYHGGKVTLSGIAGAGEYDFIGSVKISSDGSHVMHLAGRNQRNLMVLDGKDLGDFNPALIVLETYSPDGQHVAFYTITKAEFRIVVDGKEGPPGHGAFINELKIAYSPDSRRLAYVVPLPKGRKMLVVDGVEVAACMAVDDFLFSPDSQHWVAALHRGFWGKLTVLYDGKDWAPDIVAVRGLTFNPANGEPAVVALGRRGTFNFVGVHEMHLPEKYKYSFESFRGNIQFGFWGPHFTTDGKHDVYAIHDSSGSDVFADGEIVFSTRVTGLRFFKPKVKSWWLQGLALSGDGRHLAIVASSEDRVGISLVQMGEDAASGRWAPLGRREIEIPVPEKRGGELISNLLLSPSGQHFAFEVHAKKYVFLVVDGEEGPHYERFVKDQGDERGCFFETEDSVACLAAKADGLYRVTQTAPSTSPWPVLAGH